MAEERATRIFNRRGAAAEGWYWALRSRDLRRGRAKAVSVMGRDLAVYRTMAGEPVVMDAYCPHMGCHLALGKVEGDCLRCFFHNWSFGPDGACVDVPSMSKPPRQARCRVWPAAEKYGLIWVWSGKGEPEHDVPENPELSETGWDCALGRPRKKRCHPSVMMINAIDEQHFRTVHGVPGELLAMEPRVESRHNIRFENTARLPRRNALFRFLSRFYRGPLRYELNYWYGSNGFVTMGPDFLHLYLLFALRQTEDGGTESQTVALTPRRGGLGGRLLNRAVLFLTRLAGDYFSVGDTRVFQSIRFRYGVPAPADRAVQAFMRHLEGQELGVLEGEWDGKDGKDGTDETDETERSERSDVLGLSWTDVPEGPVARIVESHLAARGRRLGEEAPRRDGLWTPEFFGLHHVRIFREGSLAQQRDIVDACCRALLNEAYFIEKSGLAYCARMILLSDSVDVRQVYALISSDEAAHLQWVRPYVEEGDRTQPKGPLLRFLSELIEVCDQNTMAFLVQVMLEGWGLHHYKALAGSCNDPSLRKVFQTIHRDEALHHHTGEVVFDPKRLGAGQTALVRDSLRLYTEFVRVGPQSVVSAVDKVVGGLDLRSKTRVFEELRTEEVSAGKLEILRGLMLGPGRERFVAELGEAGAFTPYTPAACARLHGADGLPIRGDAREVGV